MNLEQVKQEITGLGKSPVAEKMYPITSDWVPLSDVLAILNRFEKHWRMRLKSDEQNASLIELLGKA